MFYIITGGYGLGKSSYLNHIANKSAFDFTSIEKTQSWIKEFDKKHGIKDRKMPEHFVFSADDMKFERVGHYTRLSHKFYPDKFGIQKFAPKGTKCQWIPFGSTIIGDEYYKYCPSSSEPLPKYQKEAYNIIRHREIEFYMASPRFKDIHKSIRDCSVGRALTERVVDIKEDNVYICWYYDEIPVGKIDAYDEADFIERKKLCTPKLEIAKYNVFNLYDDHCHSVDFDEGLEVNDYVVTERI